MPDVRMVLAVGDHDVVEALHCRIVAGQVDLELVQALEIEDDRCPCCR